MLYSQLTNDELERWCNSSPDDAAAQAEASRRVGGAGEEIECLEERIAELEDQLDAANYEISQLEEAD